jgi:hypothetical protein
MTRIQEVRTGRSLGVGQLAVFALDQETPQRDHEEDTEESAAHGEQGHLQQLRRHAPHEQCG